MKGLTDKQRRVFEYIKSHIVKINRPPTMREIGEEFTMSSTGSVRDVLRALSKKGFIEQDPNISRGIRITAGPGPVSGNVIQVPVIDKILPKTRIEDIQNRKETIQLNKSLLPDGDIFAMRLKDNSMVGAGLMKGDYVFVRRQTTCRHGQIVAFLLHNDVQFGEFTKKGKKIHLIPVCKKSKPTSMEPETFKTSLLGVMVGSFRKH